jgi:methylglutaconyl-CoA hydratase
MSLVLVESTSGITTLTLNRPEKRNALSPELIEALGDAVGAVEDDGDARVLVIAGAGKSFCAGMDLRGVISDAAAMGGMLHGLSRVMRRIRRLEIPTIARVHGAAVGGGCGLMVVTDLAVTHPGAKVGYPEVSLGVCPAVVAPWLVRKVGAGRARALLLAGGTIDGAAAERIGMVDLVCDEDELPGAVDEMARGLATGGRQALAATKSWLNTLDGSDEDRVLDRAADLSAEIIAGDEAQTRLRSILGI